VKGEPVVEVYLGVRDTDAIRAVIPESVYAVLSVKPVASVTSFFSIRPFRPNLAILACLTFSFISNLTTKLSSHAANLLLLSAAVSYLWDGFYLFTCCVYLALTRLDFLAEIPCDH
jgi:hypothetical protein